MPLRGETSVPRPLFWGSLLFWKGVGQREDSLAVTQAIRRARRGAPELPFHSPSACGEAAGWALQSAEVLGGELEQGTAPEEGCGSEETRAGVACHWELYRPWETPPLAGGLSAVTMWPQGRTVKECSLEEERVSEAAWVGLGLTAAAIVCLPRAV